MSDREIRLTGIVAAEVKFLRNQMEQNEGIERTPDEVAMHICRMLDAQGAAITCSTIYQMAELAAYNPATVAIFTQSMIENEEADGNSKP